MLAKAGFTLQWVSYEKVHAASTTYLISFSMVHETSRGTGTHDGVKKEQGLNFWVEAKRKVIVKFLQQNNF